MYEYEASQLESEADTYMWLFLMSQWSRTTRNPLEEDHSAKKEDSFRKMQEH